MSTKVMSSGDACIGVGRAGGVSYEANFEALPYCMPEKLIVTLTEGELREAVNRLDQFKRDMELEDARVRPSTRQPVL